MTSKKKLHKHRSLIPDSTKGTVDAKLTQAAIVLEYDFERDVNFKTRCIRLSKEVNAEMFDQLDAAMNELESQGRKTITIKINSPGGDVYQALAIIGRLKSSPCNIVTEGYGEIMSAATLILASGDRRRISRYAFFMHHEQSMVMDGRQSQIENELKQAKEEEKMWAQWMSEFSKKNKEFWIKTGMHVDAYFNPDELLKLGVVDEIFE